jgi:hypothetical protein
MAATPARRRDARVQLRAANEMFLAMDAEAWANRACVELGATGELARARERERATGSPRRSSRWRSWLQKGVQRGIGAQLFISPHTVAYHLRKLFSKLDVTSRTQLAMAFATNSTLQHCAARHRRQVSYAKR